MLQALKQRYWHIRGRIGKWINPPSISLTPGDWLEDVARLVPDDQSLTLVDGGAHTGDMASKFLAKLPRLHVHAFEPNADLHDRLTHNLAGVPGSIHTAALGDRTGTTEIEINSSPMTSSLLPTSSLSHQYFPDATELSETRSIPVTRLDDWAQDAGIEAIDILKLDLQGFEKQALEGARKLLRRGVRCVVLEVNFAPFYEGCSLFGDVDAILREEGYQLFNLYNLCTHRPVNHIGSADAIYIPRDRWEQLIADNAGDNVRLAA
ncbi:FkbM family methyltransferase [Mucisphaera calidilacus]|uniref:2-O-methyltransferase NoeI n=1 Tax=Mucisphaera calidilacus TaxID=2527982 RepID=A0A518BWC0_9BACT|nr:FkbM family methyltransferase [Mucisphaera calidilacus]QDU71224.1 2-O-methyltransferase NoeI [Mucisphaera calidilacus]